MKAKSEHRIQDEIREAVSAKCPGVIFRCNAGQAWAGQRRFTEEYGWVILNPRPIKLLPEGFSDLLYFGPGGHTAFLEVKNERGSTEVAQDRFLALMNRFGFATAVVRSADEAVSFVNGGTVND